MSLLILLLIIGAIHHQVVVKKMRTDALYFPVEPSKPPKVEVRKIKVVAPPKLEIAKVEQPKPSQAGDRAAKNGEARYLETRAEHFSRAAQGRCASACSQGRHVRQR